jgi:Type IX secretion system protein PorV
MRKYIIIIITMALLLAGTAQLYAGVSDAAVLFLRIAAGARAAGMGEAFVAVADDASSTHWNPAGLGMYPLSSEYHTFELDYNPHITELAMKVLKGELDDDFSETYNDFIFSADGITTRTSDGPVSSLEFELEKEISILHFVVTNVNTTERDLYKLAVRAVAKENTGASFDDINSQRLRLRTHFKNKERKQEIDTYFENMLADWQELRVKGESIQFLDEKITFAISDGIIDEKEYGEIMLVVDKAAEPLRPELVKVPYSLLFSLWKDFASPWRKNLKKIALVENGIPENNYSKYDIWGLTSNGLIHFDGRNWLEGIVFNPRSSTTLEEVVYDRTPMENTEDLDEMKLALAEANSSITWDYLNDVIDRLNVKLPADGAENLQESLEFLKTGWLNLTLNQERLVQFVQEVEKVLTAEDLPMETIDRLSFQAARVDYRRLPNKLVIPFKLALSVEPKCIEGTGRYLWVGTDIGLFRLDTKNNNWRKYTTEDGLPDNKIVSLSSYDDNSLWVATPVGLARYSREAWTAFGAEQGINDNSLYLVYAHSQKYVWAVSEKTFYVFDGNEFKDNHEYESAVNDSLSSIVRGFVGYTDKNAYVNAYIPIKTANGLTSDIPEPGTKIILPFSYAVNHRINCLSFDENKRLWIGTDYGVKIFFDGKFSLFGYKPYEVTEEMTIEDVAADYLDTQSKSKIDRLVRSIRDFNKITTNKVPAGTTLYVYSNPLGSKISAIRADGSTVYIGSEFGLLKYADERFSYFYEQGLEKQNAVAMVSKSGETWFATPSKVIVFASAKREIVVMHANWLPELADDIYYEFLSYIHHLGEEWGTLGVNVTFLSYGQLVRVDEFNNIMGTFNSFDMAIGVSYGKKMSSNLSAGLTAKWIYSRLSDQGAGNELGEGNGSSLGVDMGLLYRASKRLTLGAAITNFGPDISYIDAAQSDPLPRNLALGFSFKVINNPYNKLTIVGEVNKMLTSLNDGFSEELKEAIENFGFEYWYGSFIAFRAGYIYDQVGEVKTPTLGVGLQYRGLRFDFAYIPSSETVPLANTVRFSLTGRL